MAPLTVALENEQHGPIDVMMTFFNVETDERLQDEFERCVKSMLHKSSAQILLHLITDDFGIKFAREKFALETEQNIIEIHYYSKPAFGKRINERLSERFMDNFRPKKRSYYGDEMFMASMLSDELFPELSKLVILDADLVFREDIVKLYAEFDNFNDEQIFGLAYEQQPVYRNVFDRYRSKNPATDIGSPPPKGYPGFNSGVLLADLNKMRKSNLYKSLLDGDTITALVEKYMYQGHLGDQDFYTLIYVEYSQLFYRLSCGWNRQLCTWWKQAFPTNIFDSYYKCAENVRIYHGNCHTDVPND